MRDCGGSHGFEIETVETDKYLISVVMQLFKAVRGERDSEGVS